jgi:hypothetical protein
VTSQGRYSLASLLPALFLISPQLAAAPDDRIPRAIAQSFRTCDKVREVDQSGSKFRIISHDVMRKEFDLLDLEIDSIQGDRIYLSCSAPGCVSVYYASGGKWNNSQPENIVALNCLGAGNKISGQLRYFYDAVEAEDKAQARQNRPAEVRWRPIGTLTTKFGETEVELDQQSVQQGLASTSSAPVYGRKKNDLRSAWIRMSFPPYRSNGRSMSSAAMHVISDCYLETVKVDEMIAFSGRKGSGTELESSSSEESAQWANPVSGTPQGLAYKILCR